MNTTLIATTHKRLGSTLLAGLLAGSAALASWAVYAQTVDTSKSAVTITFKQMGVGVDAKFNKFTALVDFDPAKLATSKATVEIDVASFDLGDAAYNAEVAKKTWFNAAQFPKATFVTSAIKAAATPGKYEATGKLSIKGKTVDVTVPVSYKADASGQIFEGALPIKRLTFNIGEGEWKDTDVVADDVTIKFKVVTAIKK